MNSLILLDDLNPPVCCKDCPFVNEEFDSCEILSRAKNKIVTINRYSGLRSKKCPVYELEPMHGRLLDEKDIRSFFASMPFKTHEVKFSMSDIFSNLDSVMEIVPKYETKSDKFYEKIESAGAAIKNMLLSPQQIEDIITQVVDEPIEEDSDGREDN